MRKLKFAFVLACLGIAAIARAQTPAANHTVVRLDLLTGGTNFGKIDIELFDQEKPETVKNFLLYVYSGGYSNIALQRLEPHFVMQAGHVHIDDTNGTNVFISYEPTASLGSITNEYRVGPELSNEYGTIALARVGGQTNSGSVDWYINLTNNTALDSVDGGFTVFGRVVNTVDERSGTNLLNYFNTFQFNTNIRSFSIDSGESFEMPVTRYERLRFPETVEMFLMQASVIQGDTSPDKTPPTIEVIQPGSNMTVSNRHVTFLGTASDNQRVARVIYDRGDPFQRFRASGTENWSSDLFLSLGTNHIAFRSVDDFGNVSPTVERVLFYPFVQVGFTQMGNGKVKGITNGQTFYFGSTNRLIAKPPPGQFFLGWVDAFGNLLSVSTALDFVINEYSTNLTAVFSRNFIGLTNGAYSGLFAPHTNGPPRSSGSISLNLGRNGSYSGRLNPIGASYLIRGSFDGNGISSISGTLGADLLQLQLYLYQGYIIGLYSDGHFVSDVALFNRPKFSGTNLAPVTGSYSFLLESPDSGNGILPAGSGFGTLTVDKLGKIKMTGTLADGTVINQKSSLLIGGRWPFYSFAKKARETVLGFGQFDVNKVLISDVAWFGPNFPGNTNQNVSMMVSPYTPPSQARLFKWTNGIISLSSGGLSAPLSTAVTLHEDGSFTPAANTNNVQVSVAGETGLINGSFKHPATGALTPLRGAVLQSSNRAAGFFGSGTNGGVFVIQALP